MYFQIIVHIKFYKNGKIGNISIYRSCCEFELISHFRKTVPNCTFLKRFLKYRNVIIHVIPAS